jgi:hypothetical protein
MTVLLVLLVVWFLVSLALESAVNAVAGDFKSTLKKILFNIVTLPYALVALAPKLVAKVSFLAKVAVWFKA